MSDLEVVTQPISNVDMIFLARGGQCAEEVGFDELAAAVVYEIDGVTPHQRGLLDVTKRLHAEPTAGLRARRSRSRTARS